MKTVITIEGGKVTVQVDDEAPTEVLLGSPPLTVGRFMENLNAARRQAGKLAPPAAPVERVTDDTPPTERCCDVCGDDISGLHPLAKTCKKPECLKEKHRQANAKYLGTALPARAAAETKPPSPPVPRRIVEDEAAETQAAMDKLRADFADPWNCGMCRNAGDLCVMHENMTAQGKTPPKFVHHTEGEHWDVEAAE